MDQLAEPGIHLKPEVRLLVHHIPEFLIFYPGLQLPTPLVIRSSDRMVSYFWWSFRYVHGCHLPYVFTIRWPSDHWLPQKAFCGRANSPRLWPCPDLGSGNFSRASRAKGAAMARFGGSRRLRGKRSRRSSTRCAWIFSTLCRPTH